MVVKLSELYNTKFFYITMGKDLTYLFSSCNSLRKDPSLKLNAGNKVIDDVFSCFRVGAPVTFDLAGCKFTSDTVYTLLTAQRDYKLDLIDSQDAWRNDILMVNRERFEKYGDGVQNTVELPILTQDAMALEFIQSLQKGVLYSVPVTYDKEIWIQLCVLIQIYRPSIQLFLNGREATLLEFVASRLTPFDLQQWSEFYMITKQGVMVVDASKPFYVQRLGYVDLEQAQSVASFVPTAFGKESLKNVMVFRTIANECIRALNKYKNKRSVTLAELFE